MRVKRIGRVRRIEDSMLRRRTAHCSLCDRRMDRRRTDLHRPYRYTECGLDNVLLVGITVHTCGRCGMELPEIPKAEALHQLIAEHVARTPGRKLNGEEIRFLRKQGSMPAHEFATLLGVSAEYLSRVENGRAPSLGDAADRLVRLFALMAKDGGQGRAVLIELAQRLRHHKAASEMRAATFELADDGWRNAA